LPAWWQRHGKNDRQARHATPEPFDTRDASLAAWGHHERSEILSCPTEGRRDQQAFESGFAGTITLMA
jgi:hypothetical protein